MDKYTIEDLEERLATPPDVERLGRPDLRSIRSRGGRRRRIHRALGAGGSALGAAAVVGLLFGGAQLFDGNRGAGDNQAAEEASQPHELSPLARRALAEIPGAVQVSDWQVVLPNPGEASNFGFKLRISEPPTVPVDLPGHLYTGVTMYNEGAFPTWLYDGVADIEQEMGDEDGHPVGSTKMGILVDQGAGALGCVRADAEGQPTWLDPPSADCHPTVISRVGQDWYSHWGFGTDKFLKPDAKMEVFLTDDYSTGRPMTLAIAGMDGTDVARVDFVPVNGSPVPGKIQSGTLVKGDSIFYANVPGELARVVAYDDAGKVIEDHKLRECSGGADCEVR